MLICLLTIFSTFLLLASPVQAQPVITTSPLLPQGQVGTSYYAALTAVGGTAPYTWSYSGALPPGLSLAASGVISGKPTMAGTFNFTATVTDSTSATATQPFVIAIAQPPIRFLTTSLLPAKEEELYADTIRVSGGTSPYTWSIISGTLPTGLALSSYTGYISGTPSKGSAGNYSVTIQVTDSSSPPASGQQSFSLTVEKGGYEATITIGAGLKAGATKVYAGGSQIGTLRGGESMTLDLGVGENRSISVDPIVEHPSEPGIRFKAEEDTITVTESSSDVLFPYYTEYYIELKAEPPEVGQLSGTGWYKEDYTLRATAPDEVNDSKDPGKQYRFTYWKLPSGETVSGRDLSLPVNSAGTCIAYYDTYYRLTLTSPYGEAAGSNWYKAGSEAQWSMTNPQVRASGILGAFGGKLKAVNSSGTVLIDGPKEIAVEWEPDYTMPFILIPLAILLLILGGYGLYLLLRSAQPKPAPSPPPYYPYMPPPPPPPPIQPPQTTVVMIGGDKPQQLGPGTTREQLMEKFGELLQKYEEEIKTATTAKELPEVKTVREEKGLPSPKPTPPKAPEAGGTPKEDVATCNYTSKKPLRVVVSGWRQTETRTAPSPSAKDKTTEGETGLAIVWTRNIYQEWEILNCWLPHGHKEPHEGSVEIVYSQINTITEERIYTPGQELKPPEPHYTDNMPRVEITADEVISPDKLPPDSMS
jgi:hypothetical protein